EEGPRCRGASAPGPREVRMTAEAVVAAYVFILAIFVGFEVISKVPSTLHTPLMSGANAIHGIVIVGAMLVASAIAGPLGVVLGFLAVVLGTANVVGGFVVTDRMLAMFKQRSSGGEGTPRAPPPPGESGAAAPGAPGPTLAAFLRLIIGQVSFSRSAIAFGKLEGVITPRAFPYPAQQAVTGLLVLAIVLLAAAILVSGRTGVFAVAPGAFLLAIAIVALVFGVALGIPIGGADMPVVISLLNAYTGLAVAMAGFTLSNQLLIVAGTLVGASGTILTRLMSKAMNRSLGNVLFGAFGAAPAGGGAAATAGDDGRSIRSISAEDAAILLGYAQNVIVVPGYGLAGAQAQHNVRELADVLESKGINVRYAIHPVAGRMPGHMNVLLAEANVPYEKLFDMEQINPEFPRADVALVIGANDVTNPAARSNPGS